MNGLVFPENRKLDFICLGRANIDLYAIEHGASLFETTGFIKNVGGSPANIAAALSRLGLNVGLISKVSDDQLGHYVIDFLKRLNIDISQVQIDSTGHTRTSVAFAEVKPENCDVLFYRKNASDLNITIADIDENYIQSSRAILVSGTALSSSPSQEAMFAAMTIARKFNTLVFLELDYRSSAWTSSEDATKYYSKAAKLADVVIGNREEMQVLEFPPEVGSDIQKAQYLLSYLPQIVVQKKGAQGCTAYTAEEKIEISAYPTEVLKPYGAGDAFAGAFLYGLLRNLALDECLKMGAAAGAIVVARESCTEAMPTKEEIETFRSMN